MEIHILHDGKQIGPFTEDTVQSLLKQGNILINDLAWSPGLTGWNPLHAVLYPAAQTVTSVQAPKTAPIPEAVEEVTVLPLATPRQKAFLTYMSVPFNPELTKDHAAHLVNDAMENPKNSGRLRRWDEERFRLYPDLFADEIKARRENRAQQFLEICQGEGREFFEGVTRAHTQVLVGYLDVQYPTWDQTEHASKYDYFFPAIAEKFPQLLKKSAKGRFKYPEGPKVSAEIVRSPVAIRAKARKSSPIGAIVRGIFIGGLVLGLGVGAAELQKRGGIDALKAAIAKASEGPKPKAAKPASSKSVAASAEPATPVASTTASIPAPVSTPVAPAPTVPAAAVPAPVPTPTPTVAQASPVTPVAPMEVPPAPEPAPTGVLPANVSLFDTTPPPAVPPAGDSVTPTPAPPVAPSASPKVYAKITKPTVVNLRFGSSTIRAGTPVQVLASNGATLTIQFGPETLTIPAANTDYSGSVSAEPTASTP
ncbi:MAG TPA: DUF4339 domain-containing protein [Chthoniobacteraceae bacterium]|nr:DUF4339 domain-containing protein [Chthoniobacteraceae bacterium]